MSKKDNRYKEIHNVDVNDLDELETPRFEKFHPKKKNVKKNKTPREDDKET